MKIIVLFILIIAFCVAGYWLHQKHIQKPPSSTMNNIVQPSSYKKTPAILPNEQNKINAFFENKAPSGIIIIIKHSDSYTHYCTQNNQRHQIIYVNKNNPALMALKHWSTNPKHLTTPYTIILNQGNVIIETHGVICTY